MPLPERRLPIDSGYAWTIVFVCICIFTMAVGGLKCQGIILVELISRYEEIYSASSLLWVFSVHSMVAGVAGPIVSVLIIKFQHRAVCMLGVTLLSTSYISLAYVSSLPAMIILYSIVGGLGMRMTLASSILISQCYFDKKKGLAIGLVTGGCGAGTVVIPYVIRPLFDNLDFSSALLMYAGFNLQFLCLAALLRPLSYYQKLSTPQSSISSYTDETPDSSCITDKDSNSKGSLSSSHSHVEKKTTDHTLDLERLPRERCHTIETNTLLPRPYKLEKIDSPHLSLSSQLAWVVSQSTLTASLDGGRKRLYSVSDYAGSVVLIEGEEESNTESDRSRFGERRSSCNWGLLRRPGFIVFCICIMIFMFGQGVVYQCVPSLAEECGIPKSTVAIVIMITGGLEVPCRIANGILVDRHIITATNQFTLSLFIAGVLALACAIISRLPGIILVLFGMASAGSSFYSLMPLLLSEIVGVENVTVAIGIQTFFQSIGVIASTSISGYLYDAYNTWTTVYYYISAMMIISGGVILPYSCLVHCKRRNSNTDELPQINIGASHDDL